MEQQSAVEWYAKKEHEFAHEFVGASINHLDYFAKKRELQEQAKQMEEEQRIKAQIEILREIGNHGSNAPLYGILKTTLIQLEQKLPRL